MITQTVINFVFAHIVGVLFLLGIGVLIGLAIAATVNDLIEYRIHRAQEDTKRFLRRKP